MAAGFDHYAAGAKAALHLIEQGRESLVYLSGRIYEDFRAAKRALGFTETASKHGIPVRHLNSPAEATATSGSQLVAELFDDIADPQNIGIGCSNDWVALGAIFELQRRKVEIPKQAAIIGFGDLSFAAACNPPLSTIKPHGDRIGTEAAALIAARLAGGKIENPIINTGFQEIRRKST